MGADPRGTAAVRAPLTRLSPPRGATAAGTGADAGDGGAGGNGGAGARADRVAGDESASPSGARADRTAGDTVLECVGLSVRYEGRPLFASLSFTLVPGEALAVIGRSGCGKSTLLNVVGGLQRPDTGEIRLGDREVTGAPGHASLVPQTPLLLPWRNLLDNAILALEIAGFSRREARARAEAELAAFALEGSAQLFPHQLSGGMQQRVAVLRAYLHGAPLLLLDEPFGALDAITRREMQGWLARLIAGSGRSALLVTHDIDEALALASRLLVFLREGGTELVRLPHDEGGRRELRERVLGML